MYESLYLPHIQAAAGAIVAHSTLRTQNFDPQQKSHHYNHHPTPMSFARVLANILVQGTAVFGKAFMQAYANAASQAGKQAAEGAQAVIKRGQMTREEAIEILGTTADLLKETPDQVQEQYEKFFHANDPANGGSFYLQSKIFRAKEFLDEEERMAYEAAQEAAGEGVDSEGTSEESVSSPDATSEEPTDTNTATEEDSAETKKQERKSRRRRRRNKE